MDEINFINKINNVKFLTNQADHAIVPQIGSHTLIQDPNGVIWEGTVDMAYHVYGRGNRNIIYVVLKDIKEKKFFPF